MNQNELRKERQALEVALAVTKADNLTVAIKQRIAAIDQQLLPLRLYLFKWENAGLDESVAMVVVATSPEHALTFVDKGDIAIYVGDVKNPDIEVGILVHDFWEG